MGCGMEGGDSLEHGLFCDALRGLARPRLRLDVAAVRGGGEGALWGHLGAPGERGFRLVLHVDAALMAHNSVRHGDGDSGLASVSDPDRVQRALRCESSKAAVQSKAQAARFAELLTWACPRGAPLLRAAEECRQKGWPCVTQRSDASGPRGVLFVLRAIGHHARLDEAILGGSCASPLL